MRDVCPAFFVSLPRNFKNPFVMKRLKPLLFVVVLTGFWLLASSDVQPDHYTPYFMERAELEKSIRLETSPRDMVNPGKIWIAGNTVYIVERYKGVHIIDNTDNNLQQKGFIIAPGCMDVAVKGNIIYLDNAVDLVAVDLTTGRETKRLKNFFPEHISPESSRYGDYGRDQDLILVGWEKGIR